MLLLCPFAQKDLLKRKLALECGNGFDFVHFIGEMLGADSSAL